ADGTLDGGEDEDKEDVKAAQEKDDVEEATTEVSRNKAVDEAAQTADSVEDAKQDEKLQETVQETEEIKEDKAFDKPTEKAEDMYQQSVVLALKGWERAEKELESATEVLIFARSQWQKAVTDQNQEKQSTWDQNIKEAEKNVDKVKRDVDKAEEQFQKAAERLKEEEAKVSAAAPAQAQLSFESDLSDVVVALGEHDWSLTAHRSWNFIGCFEHMPRNFDLCF
ncbi:unnamed protein product, partial [Symbiodinium sp. KB8]